MATRLDFCPTFSAAAALDGAVVGAGEGALSGAASGVESVCGTGEEALDGDFMCSFCVAIVIIYQS